MLKALKYVEFRDWLGNQQGDRKFGCHANDCPLACFIQETRKVRVQVANGVAYNMQATSWMKYHLPNWGVRFVRGWDSVVMLDSRGVMLAIGILRSIDAEDDRTTMMNPSTSTMIGA